SAASARAADKVAPEGPCGSGFAVRPPARKQPTRLPQKVPVVRGFAVRPSAREQPTRLPQRGPLRGLLLALGREEARQRAIMSTHRVPCGAALIDLGPEAARKRAERALTVGAGEVARTSISMGILFSPRPGRGAPAGDHVHP